MNVVDCAIAVLIRDNRILVCRRKQTHSFGGYWEFPGGKRENGETPQQCVIRELREEVGVEVQPSRALPPIEHDYDGWRVRLHPFICTAIQGEPRPLECQEVRWVLPRALRDLRFPRANARLIASLVGQPHLACTESGPSSDPDPNG